MKLCWRLLICGKNSRWRHSSLQQEWAELTWPSKRRGVVFEIASPAVAHPLTALRHSCLKSRRLQANHVQCIASINAVMTSFTPYLEDNIAHAYLYIDGIRDYSWDARRSCASDCSMDYRTLAISKENTELKALPNKVYCFDNYINDMWTIPSQRIRPLCRPQINVFCAPALANQPLHVLLLELYAWKSWTSLGYAYDRYLQILRTILFPVYLLPKLFKTESYDTISIPAGMFVTAA